MTISTSFLRTIHDTKLIFGLFHIRPYILREAPDEHPVNASSYLHRVISEVLRFRRCEGTVPVVAFDGDRLHVQAAIDDKSYIVFSHVWRMGSGFEAPPVGLPACQVSRLPTRAWMDSLPRHGQIFGSILSVSPGIRIYADAPSSSWTRHSRWVLDKAFRKYLYGP